MTTTKFITSTDGSQIYAQAVGDASKPALVLVPGYTLSTMVFDKQFSSELLKKDLYLIRYDPRGHGQSSKPETPESYTSKLYADDFKAVCDAFGISKPFFAGWSLAGCIAADILTHLGASSLSGIIYIGALLTLEPAHLSSNCTPTALAIIPGVLSKDDVTLYKESLVKFGQSVVDPWQPPYEVASAWLGVSVTQPSSVSGIVVSRKVDTEGLVEAGKNGLPVLCIHGTKDGHRPTGMEIVEELRPFYGEKKDAIEVVEVENGGHAFFYQFPEETNKAFLRFINKVVSH